MVDYKKISKESLVFELDLKCDEGYPYFWCRYEILDEKLLKQIPEINEMINKIEKDYHIKLNSGILKPIFTMDYLPINKACEDFDNRLYQISFKCIWDINFNSEEYKKLSKKEQDKLLEIRFEDEAIDKYGIYFFIYNWSTFERLRKLIHYLIYLYDGRTCLEVIAEIQSFNEKGLEYYFTKIKEMYSLDTLKRLHRQILQMFKKPIDIFSFKEIV